MIAPGSIDSVETSTSATSPRGDVWRWDAVIAAEGRAPRIARRAVGEACAPYCDAATLVDVQLVVSELVTNCFEHGDVDVVRVCLVGVDERITVTVASPSSLEGVPQPDAWCLPSATADSGRGLAMIGRVGRAGLQVGDAGADAWSAITVHIEPRSR